MINSRTLARPKLWNIDIVLCSSLMLLGPYFILDVLSRSITSNVRFQFDWIIISLSCVRLAIIACSRESAQKKSLFISLKVFLPLFLVIFYTCLITFNQIDFLIDNNLYYGSISTSFIVNRGIKYLVYTALALYFAVVVNTWQKFYTIILCLVSGICLAEVLGLVQEAVFLSSGVDILPITRTRESEFLYVSATVDFLGQSFLRINSLAHEPKGLAALTYILLIFKVYASSWLHHAKQYLRIPSLLSLYLEKTFFLSILVIVLTFSGSGLISTLFILGVVFLTSFQKFLVTGKISYDLRLLTVAICALLIAAILIPGLSESFLDASIMRRASGFFEERNLESLYSGSTDPEDAAAIINILEFPQVTFTGIGFGGYSNLALPIVASMYRGATVETISSFSRNISIELLFSSGIIGIIGSLFFAQGLFRYFRVYPNLYMPLGLVIVSSFLIRSNEVFFFVFIGLVCAVNYLIQTQSNYHRSYSN